MKPIATPDTNHEYVGAEGSDVLPLPVCIEDGVVMSTWVLDEEDRRQLAEGGAIGLAVWSEPIPPMAITITAPYCEKCRAQMKWEPALGIFCCGEHEAEET